MIGHLRIISAIKGWLGIILFISPLSLQQGVRIVSPNEPTYHCEELTVITWCSYIYPNASFPNYRGHEDQFSANRELLNFTPLVQSVCSNAIVHFLCSIYAPFCQPDLPNHRIRPCRELCDYVRSTCEEDLQNFNLEWPPHLDCDNFMPNSATNLDFCPENLHLLRIPAQIPTFTSPSATSPATEEGGASTTTTQVQPEGTTTEQSTTLTQTTTSDNTTTTTQDQPEGTTTQESVTVTTIQPPTTRPMPSLYFELNGQTYPSGSKISITDIGVANPNNLLDTASALVCVTSEVNTQCCRRRDGGNVGEWFLPDGSIVPRLRNSPNGDFTRSGFRHHVRLNRRNDAMAPLGTYTCLVPDERDGSVLHTATLELEVPGILPREVLCFCSVCVWRAPEGSLDRHRGYDIRFSGELVIGKGNDEFFHVVAGDERITALGLQEGVTVEVRVRSEGETVNPWSGPVSLCSNE